MRMLVMSLQMGTGTKLEGFQGVNLQKLSFSEGGGMGLESETGDTSKIIFQVMGLVLFSAIAVVIVKDFALAFNKNRS